MIIFLSLLISCTTHHNLQLVESVPSELSADHKEIPNADVVWKKLFDDAEKSIDLASFYISPSPQKDALDPVWNSLKKAAQRGVQIRILIDKKFSDKYPDPIQELLKWPNTTLKLSDYDPGVMHAKYFIIDNKEGFLGSQNFDYRALEHIFELGFHITDPLLVQSLRDVFLFDWNPPSLNHKPQNSTPKKSNPDKEQPLLFVASPPNKLPTSATYDLPEILSLIRNAEHSLRLQFLSYNNKNRDGTSWNVLDNTLIDAVNRGVHVELMVSDWSKKGSKGASLEKLKQNGVHISIISIPEHSSGPIPFARTIHAKYIVSDTKNCWLGTSNASQGYFTTSRNVGLILKKRTECAQLHQIFTEIQQMQAK